MRHVAGSGDQIIRESDNHTLGQIAFPRGLIENRLMGRVHWDSEILRALRSGNVI